MDTKEPIKVAQIIGKWVGGGVEAVVMNYYRNIDHTKIQFDFICDENSTNIPYKEINSLGGNVILIPPYQKLFQYQRELKKVLRNGKYTIVHSHINTLSVFPLFIAKKVGIAIRIAHSHSTTNGKEIKKNFIKQILRPFSKMFATDYFCCSEHAGIWLFGKKEYYKGNVFVLNNAIDLEKFIYNEETRIEKRKELGIKENTLVIGNIGRFVPQKNHAFLIDIFFDLHKKRQNSKLLLVGQGPLVNDIKQKVHDLHLDECVEFLEQRNDVNEIYQAFDIFVLPSLYEGLGMVLIEAQVSGCLCLTSTEVPKQVKITDNLSFIDLSEHPSKWAEEALVFASNKIRVGYKKEAILAGYDIKKETKILEKKYKELIQERCQ